MRKILRAILFVFCLAGVAHAEVPQSREQITLSFAPVVKETAPAVVNIYAKRTVKVRQNLGGVFSDPFFQQFFGGNKFSFGAPIERVQNSLGSGVIIESNGLIVTNAHVIDGADKVTVVLSDRREFPAQIKAVDKKTDLALLKIEPKETLPVVPFANSDSLNIGDLVLAIGNPFGVGQTVTSGIVSALARTDVGVSDYQFFIQTDAAINPGNSGGALVDMSGKLVGINSAIYSRDGGSLGIGFAIPIEMVKTVVADLSANGKVIRPWLGASGQPVTQDIAESMGMTRPVGVLINDIYKGGPADQAGLRSGDVVTAVAGREVDDIGALRYRLATMQVGKQTTLNILRKGESKTLDLDLKPAPETTSRDLTILKSSPLAGLQVANISPALMEEMGLDINASGVMVMAVKSGTSASRFPIRKGDIIAQINGQVIKSVTQLARVTSQPSQVWSIVIQRGDEQINLTIR